MCTVIRPVVSNKNPYAISKERYYELKHFCLQYSDYKRRMALERSKSPISGRLVCSRSSAHVTDKVGEMAANLVLWDGYIKMIDSCCKEAGGDIASYLHECVTKGKSYATIYPPCSKEYFYQRYRKFFWLLDKRR